MKKRIISSILLSLSLFCGISMVSTISNFVETNETQNIGNIKIKRSSEKIMLPVTKSYFLTADDAITEKKVTYSYPCGAINVNVKNDYAPPFSNYVEGKGVTFATGSITVKPVSGCTIINFSLNFSENISWSYYKTSNIGDVSKCVENGDMHSITITPADASKAIEIYHSASKNGFLGFSVKYEYLHDHNPTWMTEEENHWKECECGLSEYTTEKEPHNFNEEVSYLEPTHTVSGEKVLRCECGKEKSVEVPALGHTQTDIWQSDDFNHWKECECTDPATEFEKAEHNWLFKETVNEPSIEEAGRAVYYCESCGREKEDLSYLNVTDANIKIEAVNSLTYTGKEQIQEVEVYYGDTKLNINEHYTLFNENRTDAGDYVLNITGIGTFRGETTFDYSIAKAPLTISVENYEINYGDLAPTFAVSYIGFVNEETETVLEGALSFACEYDQFDDVNEYVITASGLSSNNYEITYIDGKLKVNPKEIGLDWSNLNLIYNGENQIPTATATGLLNDDECIVAVSGEEINAGTYTANAIALSNSNYKLPNVTTSQYTIEPKAIDGAVVTLKDTLVYTGTELTQEVESVVLDGITLIKDVDYTIKENKGTVVDTYTLTVEGKGNYKGIITKDFEIIKQKVELPTANTDLIYNGSTQIGVESTKLYDVVNGEAKNVGSFTAVATLKDTDNYEWAKDFDGEVAWEITPKEVTVVWENVEDRIYTGNELSYPTATIDTYEGSIDLTPTIISGGTEFVNVSKYQFKVEFNNDNYTITNEVSEEIEILKATFNMNNAKWDYTVPFTYDGTEKTVSIIDLPEGVTVVSYSGNKATNANSYKASVVLSYDSENYNEISIDDLEWAINPKEVGLTWGNAEFTYDRNEHLPTVSLTGVVNGDECEFVVNGTQTNAGTYTATVTTLSNSNYVLPVDSTKEFTINKAVVTVPAQDTTVFTYNGEEQTYTVVTDALYTVTGTNRTDAGSQKVTVSLVDPDNYQWSNGNSEDLEFDFVINKKVLTVTVENKEVTYGDEIPTYTVSYNGFVNNETKDVLGGTLAFTCNYEQFDDVGEYEIIASGYTSNNYEISYVAGNLKVNPKEVGLTWGETVFTYNGKTQAPTVEATGLVNNDVCLVTVIGEQKDAGTYTATAASLSNKNYKLPANVTTSYEIEKAQLTVSVKDENVTYGDAIPTYTVSYNGFVNNETKDVLGGTLAFTCTYSQTSNVGEYEIIASGYTSNNYEISYVEGTIEVAQKEIGLRWGNAEFTYNGEEQLVEVTATGLVNGDTCIVTVIGGKTNAGTYIATATTLSNSNYVLPTNVTKEFVINKKVVETPEVTTSFIYNGKVQTILNATELYTVEESSKTNVGYYKLVLTLVDAANYKWEDSFSGEISWTITKATYDMSGISFDNKTVAADGKNHALVITGTLPSGVTVTYSMTECVEPGVYEITATFSGDYANYNEIASKKAKLIIKQSELKPETNLEEGHENDVIVSSPEGIDPDKQLTIEMINPSKEENDYSKHLNKNQKAAVSYNISLFDKKGEEAQPESALIIKLLIPQELINAEFGIMHIHNENEKTMMEFTIEGDYAVITTNNLSEFVFVYDVHPLDVPIIILAVVALLEVGLLLFLMNKKKQIQTKKIVSVYPPFVFGVFILEWQLVLLILLAAVVVVLATVNVIYAMGLLGINKKLVADTVTVERTNEPKEEVHKDKVEDETIKIWNKETHTYKEVRIIKGFASKLSQSTEEIKNYYDVIKNELLSYSNVKSKISFKHEIFKLGKETQAKLKFRGKTLCLYLALNPMDYGNTKYKVVDMSKVSHSVDVPTMYRINLPRRVNYAKELIADLMKKLNVEKSEKEFIVYSNEYPYLDNEELFNKGLLKRFDKKQSVE